MTLEQHINNLNQRYQLGNATEHTFRGDLQQLLESVVVKPRFELSPLLISPQGANLYTQVNYCF
jgi:hypothetical protein